jgi:hypothetical protein
MYEKIDVLKHKVANNQRISLDEACFVIWAELGCCSHQYKQFANWIIKNQENNMRTWQMWEILFTGFCEKIYNRDH